MMFQRTFEIKTKGEAVGVSQQLQKQPYTSAASALLKVFVLGFSYDEACEIISPIRELFPDITVLGMTVYMADPFSEKNEGSGTEILAFDEEPVLRLGFFFFESSQIRALSCDLDKMTVDEVLDTARGEIASDGDVKGVCVTAAGFSCHISAFLERLTRGFEELPFFGTMADVNYIAQRSSVPYIFDAHSCYENALIFLLYTGKELSIDVEYIFGWKPIGKAMPAAVSDRELTAGDTMITAIDGEPPEEIYNKYLGIRFDGYLTANTCEFPLVVERDGLLIGRTPFDCTDDGSILTVGAVHPDEKVRFSYAVREDLIANTETESRKLGEFAPQAIEIFICGNRAVMLRNDANIEVECFRRIVPDTLHCSAAGEIYLQHGKGDFLNSALVAAGFREGAPQKLILDEKISSRAKQRQQGEKPLSERILRFLQAMSADLMEYAQAAQQANNARSAFPANMSHDIRTPVNAVLGMNEMIQRECPSAEILVADDTPMDLEVFSGLLKKTLVRIDTARSGQQCLDMAARKKYDIIFLDHMMPHMDGIETLHELKAMENSPNADTPVICLTANAVSGSMEMYLREGFDDYIAKPADPMRLEHMMMEYLPGSKPEDAEEKSAAPKENERSGILIIDDDPIVRMTAEKILSPDYDITGCDNGAGGVRLARQRQPDLILLDIYLSDSSGFDVLKQLRSFNETHDIPVMFITGDISKETEVKALQSGASDYVRKPFISEVLLQRSKRIIDLYHFQSGLRKEIGRQTERADRLSLEMMMALSKTVDAKDHYTNGHSGRVADYAAEIARRMGKSLDEQKKIYEMGLMHDIGKIGVSEEIINKSSRLTDEEFIRIKKHTTIGYDILSSITEMPDLSVGARSHHERYDGKGYPDGLKGDEIPESARIICVADCYDAMTSTRTYSKPKAQAEVRAEIVRCSGSQFDPKIAAVMIQMIDDDPGYKMNEQGDTAVWKSRDELWNVSEADKKPEEENGIPRQLKEIAEINAKDGLKYCGAADIYLSAVKTYAESAESAAAQIEGSLRSKDVKNAAVKIHAIKSTSRVIGAMKLGAFAEKLELAGKSGDTDTLYKGSPELISRIRSLGRELSALIKKEELPLISEEKLGEALTLIKEFLSAEDYESTLNIIEDLKGYSFPEKEKKRCEALIKAASEFDYDAVSDIIER